MADPATLWHPSPNFGDRKDGHRPELVVLHYTAMRTAQEALARLSDPTYEVSAHYLIGRCGQIWQLVEEDKRAWHAGAGDWAGQGDVNSRSIGIELSNSGAEPFSEPLMSSLEVLLNTVMTRWAIPPEGVIGHSDMAPGRKIDPGPRFDWARLERQGQARSWSATEPFLISEKARFRMAARQLGYTADVDEATLSQAVALRFRQFRPL